MADSTTNIDQLNTAQANKEPFINAQFDAASPSMLYGRRDKTTSGLTWGYYGGRFNTLSIANGTLTLSASATNYIEADNTTGAVSVNTSGWTASGKKRLYKVVCGSSVVSSYEDHRELSGGSSGGSAGGSAQALLTDFANNAATTTGLTYGYSAGVIRSDNSAVSVAAGTVTLSASATNYVEVSGAGTVSANSTAFTAGRFPMAVVVTGAGSITSTTDKRGFASVGSTGGGAAVTQCIPIAASDETTALTTGTAKVTFRMPFAFTLSSIRASLTTAQTSGSLLTVDVKKNGTSLFSTLLTFDNTEKTTKTAATAAVLAATALADDDEMTVNITQVGDGTAKGLKVYLLGVAS